MEQEAQRAILGCLAWRIEDKRAKQRAYNQEYRARRRKEEAKGEMAGLVALFGMGYILFKSFERFVTAAGYPKAKPKPKEPSAAAMDALWRE